jgi:hypothetical protein
MISMQASAVFVAIVAVTHRYTITAIMISRMPTVFDILIPYTLGVGEIGAAQLIGYETAWWVGVLVFAIAAIAAYLHSRSRTTIATFAENYDVYAQFREITTRAILFLSPLIPISVTLITLGAFGDGSIQLYALSPIIFTASTLSIEIFGHYRMPSAE